MSEIEEKVIKILQNRNNAGNLKSRESTELDFKQSIGKQSFPKYARTMASFANNKGGLIIFGVKDRPRKPVGINKQKFESIDEAEITEFINEHFIPEIRWERGVIELDKIFCYIYTFESTQKPIICKKPNGKELKNGEIYYRYRGQTRRIEYTELKQIIDEYREKEKRSWMQHIEKIAKIGPQNIALIDVLNGKLSFTDMKGAQLVVSEELMSSLIENMKFIREGKFSETEGEPTLKLVGELQTVDAVIPADFDPDSNYPYNLSKIAEKTNLSRNQALAIIWKYGIKENKKFCISMSPSESSNPIYKYSVAAIEKINQILEKQNDREDFLNRISHEYYNAIYRR